MRAKERVSFANMASASEGDNSSHGTDEFCNEHHEILSVNELNSPNLFYEDRTIRTWGKVISHDIHAQQAMVEDEGGAKLLIDTAKIEPYGFTLGFYYHFFGHIVKNSKSIMTLQVLTVACINELHIDLFVKALELRRKFLSETI